jgi:spore germination cell wall hydrolase CwlJ-like protein
MVLIKVLILVVTLLIPTTVLSPEMQFPLQRINASNKDVICLAKNIYHEARGESFLGQVAVAQTTINRALHPRFKNTICGVVFSPNQFSWTSSPNKIKNKKAYDQALLIANGVILGTIWLEGFTATHYHTNKVNPTWNRSLKKVAVIGAHIFYD